MTLLQSLELRLARFTYKPRYRFHIEVPREFCGFMLVLSSLQPSVADPEREVVIVFRRSLPLDVFEDSVKNNERYFDIAVEGLIHDFEAHETAEWFKFDGKCVHEPHPDIKPLVRTREVVFAWWNRIHEIPPWGWQQDPKLDGITRLEFEELRDVEDFDAWWKLRETGPV